MATKELSEEDRKSQAFWYPVLALGWGFLVCLGIGFYSFSSNTGFHLEAEGYWDIVQIDHGQLVIDSWSDFYVLDGDTAIEPQILGQGLRRFTATTVTPRIWQVKGQKVLISVTSKNLTSLRLVEKNPFFFWVGLAGFFGFGLAVFLWISWKEKQWEKQDAARRA